MTMTDRATAGSPLAIDRVDRSRAEGGCVALRLRGRWLEPAAVAEEELLVVQIEGRRHRFTGTRAETGANGEGPGTLALWEATFTVPDWAEPRHEGQAALWLGSIVIPVPPPGWSPPSAPAQTPEQVPQPPTPPEQVAPPRAPEPMVDEPSLVEPGQDTPRSGPLADLLLRETVAALHTGLEQRTSEAVQLRGALADAHTELESRRASAAALESTQQQLRTELERLTSLVGQHRDELQARGAELEGERGQLGQQLAHLREELAAAQVARDAAVGEAAGLRVELERIGAELVATRERLGAESGDLGEANRLLADARALAEQLRSG
jgi:hypothetical protein